MIDRETEIIFNEKVAENTFLMGLDAPETASEASPGQFVMLRAGRGMDPLLRRPFSICGILEGNLVLILFKVVGKGTKLISGFEEGDRVHVLGPLGRGFSRPDPGTEPLLAAGGIGIAPLVFLAQTLPEKHWNILAGYRCAGEIISLEKMGLKTENIFVATDDGSAGFSGFVTDLLKGRIGENPEERIAVYACGPVPMLRKVARMAMNAELPCQLSLETHMACGLGACQGCAVKASPGELATYHLACQAGPVFNARAIDWDAL